MRTTPDDLIGSREACRILDIDKSTLSRWVAAGRLVQVTQLPGKNGAYLFTRAAVEALLPEPAEQATA
jgi:predicted site-specific integrase-resolvase